MQAEKNTIIFTLVYRNKEYKMQTRKDQYRSLMCLISDHFSIAGFGICYGGGSCGTCGVEIKEKCTGTKKFVLSCEIMIDDDLVNKTINVR